MGLASSSLSSQHSDNSAFTPKGINLWMFYSNSWSCRLLLPDLHVSAFLTADVSAESSWGPKTSSRRSELIRLTGTNKDTRARRSNCWALQCFCGSCYYCSDKMRGDCWGSSARRGPTAVSDPIPPITLVPGREGGADGVPEHILKNA